MFSPTSRLGLGTRRKLRRFLSEERGIAAVEFAALVPMILFMLVGVVEVSRAVAIDRRFSHATSMIADLVAREEKMSAADLTAIYKIIDQVMSPYDASSLKVGVIPVKASPSDASKTMVYPGTGNRPAHNGGSLPGKCSSYTLGSALIAKGASVIVVESTYEFRPIFLNFVLGPSSWTSKAYATPRNSCVDFDNDKCVSTCF
jgi:Flp pilus assembly protein TadG